MAPASARVRAQGFSTMVVLPRERLSITLSRWRKVGVQMSTTSTPPASTMSVMLS